MPSPPAYGSHRPSPPSSGRRILPCSRSGFTPAKRSGGNPWAARAMSVLRSSGALRCPPRADRVRWSFRPRPRRFSTHRPSPRSGSSRSGSTSFGSSSGRYSCTRRSPRPASQAERLRPRLPAQLADAQRGLQAEELSNALAFFSNRPPLVPGQLPCRLDADLDTLAALCPAPDAGDDAVDQQGWYPGDAFVAAAIVLLHELAYGLGNEVIAFAKAHHVAVVLRQEPEGAGRSLAQRGLDCADRVHQLARRRRLDCEPAGELGGPGGAVGGHKSAADLGERGLGIDILPVDPLIGADERDLVAARRAVAELSQESRGSDDVAPARGDPPAGPPPCSTRDLVGQLFAQERAPVERVADRVQHFFALLGREVVRLVPGRLDRAHRGRPQRGLVGGMDGRVTS